MSDPNCPMYLDRAVKQIRELEAESSKWLRIAQDFERENEALREAAQAVVDVHRMNSVHPCQAMDTLAALLETDDE